MACCGDGTIPAEWSGGEGVAGRGRRRGAQCPVSIIRIVIIIIITIISSSNDSVLGDDDNTNNKTNKNNTNNSKKNNNTRAHTQ